MANVPKGVNIKPSIIDDNPIQRNKGNPVSYDKDISKKGGNCVNKVLVADAVRLMEEQI